MRRDPPPSPPPDMLANLDKLANTLHEINVVLEAEEKKIRAEIIRSLIGYAVLALVVTLVIIWSLP